MDSFSTLGRLCLIAVGLSTESVALVKDTERLIPDLESDFSKPIKGRIGGSPCSFSESRAWSLEIRRTLKEVIRRLKVPEALKFLSFSFLVF